MANWYRVDKSNGEVKLVVDADVNVRRAASGAYAKPAEAMASGRFVTTFAIYTRADQMTADEREAAGLRADGRVDCPACGTHGSGCQEDLDNGTTICHVTGLAVTL